jgi:hypothetical protein
MRLLASATLVLVLATCAAAADKLAGEKGPVAEDGFISLFDGHSLDGWKVGENAETFSVADGMIRMNYNATNHHPAHLFYVGDVQHHEFKNFDLKVDVMTFPHANSGIYFHTKYQEVNWPKFGIECQVNNSHGDWRRTGSLWGIKNISWGPATPPKNNREEVALFEQPPVTDNVWYTQEVIYVNGQVVVKLNGKTVVEYTVADADVVHKLPTPMTWLPRGTFALQGHPPEKGRESKTNFKNIRVKPLPD